MAPSADLAPAPSSNPRRGRLARQGFPSAVRRITTRDAADWVDQHLRRLEPCFEGHPVHSTRAYQIEVGFERARDQVGDVVVTPDLPAPVRGCIQRTLYRAPGTRHTHLRFRVRWRPR